MFGEVLCPNCGAVRFPDETRCHSRGTPYSPSVYRTREQQEALEQWVEAMRHENQRYLEQMERDRQKRIADGVEEA